MCAFMFILIGSGDDEEEEEESIPGEEWMYENDDIEKKLY